MATEPYGQWAWVYECGFEPDRSLKHAGKLGEACFCLPASFIERLGESDLLRRVNSRFGTLLDYYEEEDVRDPKCLAFVAGLLDQAFRGHEVETIVLDLVAFLLQSADEQRCVTFWL